MQDAVSISLVCHNDVASKTRLIAIRGADKLVGVFSERVKINPVQIVCIDELPTAVPRVGKKVIEDADSYGTERGSFPVLGWYLKNLLFHSGNYLRTLKFLLMKAQDCH